MNTVVFLLAAVIFVLVSWFVYRNYPAAWRQNNLFRKVLYLYHVIGLTCLIMIFTPLFRRIPYENIRYELSRVGTFYYIPLLLMALQYLVLHIYTRTYQFILKYTGREMSRRAKKHLIDRQFFAVLFGAVSFGICILGYFNIDFIQLQTYEVKAAAKSSEKELTICLVSDVHAGAGTWEYTYDDMQEIIDACNADVLLLDGDIFDETTNGKDMDNFFWVLETIRKPRYGIFYVSGNHDEPSVADEMAKRNITVLDGDMAVIGGDIQLIGVADGKHSETEIRRLFDELQPDPDKPIITMIHRPIQFSTLSSLGSDLAVSGHTHGFNAIQFLGTPLFGDMFCGITNYGDMTAITTSGVSAWGYHYKWPAQSEIVKIHMTFDQAGN